MILWDAMEFMLSQVPKAGPGAPSSRARVQFLIMLKCLAILAVLMTFAQTPSPIRAQTADHTANSLKSVQKQNAELSSKGRSAPPPISQNSAQPTDRDAGAPRGEDNQNSVTVSKLPTVSIGKDWADWSYWGFGGILVIVGALQVWLLRGTLRRTTQQADLMKRQTELMETQAELMRIQTNIHEASLMQWVDLQPHGIYTETKSKSEPPEKVTINLRWRILNNTDLPFTVRSVEAHICRDRDWEVFEFRPEEVIPPLNEKGRSNFYEFRVPFDLTRSQTKRFLNGGISLSVMIGVVFVEATGKEKRQSFGDMYECDLKVLEINESLGQGPKNMWIEKDDSPSTIRLHKMTIVQPDVTSDSLPDPPK